MQIARVLALAVAAWPLLVAANYQYSGVAMLTAPPASIRDLDETANNAIWLSATANGVTQFSEAAPMWSTGGTTGSTTHTSLVCPTTLADCLVTISGQHSVARLASPAWTSTTFVGDAGTAGELSGTGTAARLTSPLGLAWSGTKLYVATRCHIASIDLSTTVATVPWSGSGTDCTGATIEADGAGAATRYLGVRDVATNDGQPQPFVFVADMNRIRVVDVNTAVSFPRACTGHAYNSLPQDGGIAVATCTPISMVWLPAAGATMGDVLFLDSIDGTLGMWLRRVVEVSGNAMIVTVAGPAPNDPAFANPPAGISTGSGAGLFFSRSRRIRTNVRNGRTLVYVVGDEGIQRIDRQMVADGTEAYPSLQAPGPAPAGGGGGFFTSDVIPGVDGWEYAWQAYDSVSHEGLLRLRPSMQAIWGYACPTGFGAAEAATACRSLRMSGANATRIASKDHTLVSANDPIYIRNATCHDACAPWISSCIAPTQSTNCLPQDAVWLRCAPAGEADGCGSGTTTATNGTTSGSGTSSGTPTNAPGRAPTPAPELNEGLNGPSLDSPESVATVAVVATAAVVPGPSAPAIQSASILLLMGCRNDNSLADDVGGKSAMAPFAVGKSKFRYLLALVAILGAAFIANSLYFAIRVCIASRPAKDETKDDEKEDPAAKYRDDDGATRSGQAAPDEPLTCGERVDIGLVKGKFPDYLHWTCLFAFQGIAYESMQFLAEPDRDWTTLAVGIAGTFACVGFTVYVQVFGTFMSRDEELAKEVFIDYADALEYTCCQRFFVGKGGWTTDYSTRYGNLYDAYSSDHSKWCTAIQLWRGLLFAALAAVNPGNNDGCFYVYMAIAAMCFLFAVGVGVLRPHRLAIYDIGVTIVNLVTAAIAVMIVLVQKYGYNPEAMPVTAETLFMVVVYVASVMTIWGLVLWIVEVVYLSKRAEVARTAKRRMSVTEDAIKIQVRDETDDVQPKDDDDTDAPQLAAPPVEVAPVYAPAPQQTDAWGEPAKSVEAPLPPGWRERKTANGTKMYYNDTTKQSSWTRPT